MLDKIKDYSQGGKQEFFANSMISDAIIRRLQTLAESTQRLSEELKANIPDVDWRNISGFRNILVHDYLGGIDLNTVWDVVAVFKAPSPESNPNSPLPVKTTVSVYITVDS